MGGPRRGLSRAQGRAQGARRFRQLGELDVKAGRHAAALPSLEKAVALAPADPELRLNLARSFAQVERWHDASNAAREAQRLMPKSIDALVLGAEAAYRQGKNGEAIETLKRAVALDPEPTTSTSGSAAATPTTICTATPSRTSSAPRA
jgi:Flp pilus assembly protein TadD